ncbi:MAG: DUF2083 domain-containing protein [Proteobacteria bacterium]|nr:DUF2083 domain-containing protein [Pseudomonadota bacterium]
MIAKQRSKLFAGGKVRAARLQRGWSLAEAGEALGISISYLSQIETDQRPVSQRVLLALFERLGLAPADVEGGDEERLLADLREACANSPAAAGAVPLSEIRRVSAVAPQFARAFLDVQREFWQADQRLKLIDQAVGLAGSPAGVTPLPYEEVRDYFHYRDNYIDTLDMGAEALAAATPHDPDATREAGLERLLQETLGVRVRRTTDPSLVRRFDRADRTLWLNAGQAPETRAFQMATHLVGRHLEQEIDAVLRQAGLRNPQSADVCRLALMNYAAGAFLMPYRRFAAEARRERHDIERLALLFGVSLEQVCHRLSNLQRPGERGVPIYFLRMDRAGNITKRHSATRLQFARFGGTCPLWNIHEAFGAPDRFLVQLVEMPDGARYLSVALSVVKPSGAFHAPGRRYVLAIGCEAADARELVYADTVDLDAPGAPIGVGCRICERSDCAQRAFPPLDREIAVAQDRRDVVPFTITARP